MSKLADAFRALSQVTRPRPDQSEGGIEAGARRLFATLSEYPEAVALRALDAWPRQSEWFPTEFELRGLCATLAADAAREEAASSYVGGGRYNKPDGIVMQFVERVRTARGEGYVKSWLAGGVTCQFGHNRIYTTGIGAERLLKDFGPLAYDLSVAVIADVGCMRMLAEYCDGRDLQFDTKRARR